jgi:protoporphyrinogen oxidase
MRETRSGFPFPPRSRALHALEQKYGSLIKGQFQGARERRRAAGKAANAAGSFSFRNGMQTLTDALARAVTRVTTQVVIGQIEREADGNWTVTGTRGRRALHAIREERRARHPGV